MKHLYPTQKELYLKKIWKRNSFSILLKWNPLTWWNVNKVMVYFCQLFMLIQYVIEDVELKMSVVNWINCLKSMRSPRLEHTWSTLQTVTNKQTNSREMTTIREWWTGKCHPSILPGHRGRGGAQRTSTWLARPICNHCIEHLWTFICANTRLDNNTDSICTMAIPRHGLLCSPGVVYCW